MLGEIVSISDLSIYCAIRNGSADPRLGHVPNPNSLLIGIHPPEWTDLIWTSPALFGGPLTLGTWGKLPPRRQHCPYCQRRPACWTKRKTTPHYYSSWRLYTSATLIVSWSTETRALPFQNTDNWSWTMLHGSHSTLRKMRKLLQHKKYPSIQNAWRPKHYK